MRTYCFTVQLTAGLFQEIIVFAKETRIALRKSDIMSKIEDHEEQRRQLKQVDQVYLDLRTGQQCVRDFFICLNENAANWIDLHDFLSFDVVDSTMCSQCHKENKTEQRQTFLEMEVPPDGTCLGQYVEEHFNESFFVDYFCDGCESQSLAEKRLFLKASPETNFLVVLLRRSVLGDEGNFIVTNRIKSVEDIKIK